MRLCLLLFCRVVNRRKRRVRCANCDCLFHVSCVGLTRAQADAFGRWNFEQCQGVARVPTRPRELNWRGILLGVTIVWVSWTVFRRWLLSQWQMLSQALDGGSSCEVGPPTSLSYCSPVDWGKFRFQRWLGSRLPDLWKALLFWPYRSPREWGMGSVKGMALWREK